MFIYESGKSESCVSIFEILLIIIGILFIRILLFFPTVVYFQLGLETVKNTLIRAINNFVEY